MPENKNGGMALIVRPPAFGLPTGCPRCLFSFLYLRLAAAGFQVEYRLNTPDSDDLPMVELGLLAGYSSESGGVEDFLRQEGVCDLDADVTDMEKPELQAFKTLVMKLQDAVDMEIWSINNPDLQNLTQNEEVAGTIYTSGLPWPLSKAIQFNMRQKVMERLGVTRENLNNRSEAIYLSACSAYDALSTRKCSETFFLSDKPTSLDAHLLAHLLFVINVPLQSRLRNELNSNHSRLINYAESYYRSLKTSPIPQAMPYPRRTPSPGTSSSASSSRRSSKSANTEPKTKPTPKDKEFAWKGKLFLATQLVAVVGFLLIFGLDFDYEDA